MWIEETTGELSTVGVAHVSPWVTSALMTRLAKCSDDWIAGSEDILDDLREEAWVELGEPAWSSEEDSFRFKLPPVEIQLDDDGEVDLDESLRVQVRSVELRWRFDLLDILSEAIARVEEAR